MYLFGMIVLMGSLSWGLTGYLRRYALRTNLLDMPNHRSSHELPTPRGAGVAIVVTFSASVLILGYTELVASPLTMALIISGLLVAAFGFCDDLFSVPAQFRLLAHLVAAVFAVSMLGGMPPIHVFGWLIPNSFVSSILAVIYLMWLLNLYNFMDGIDGIAGVEALFVCLGGALLYGLGGNYLNMALPLALAASVAGFLYWNFPPARIFMGDVGSGFLGLTLGILSIQAAGFNPRFFWSWLILLGVFIVDATVTLIRRAMNGDTVYEAHCNHAYQSASRYFNSHLLVVIMVLALNFLWLLPIAVIVSKNHIDGIIGLLIAYIPLVIIALRFNAGKANN